MRYTEFKPKIIPRDQLVNVFIHGQSHGRVIKHLVAKNFPQAKIDDLIHKLVDEKGVNPRAIYWEASALYVDETLDELLQPEVTDGKGFEITKHDELGLEWTAASQGNNELVIEVKQQGQVIAQAIFRTTENPDDLNSDDTWVDKNYRRMGIATKMYNWAQELGNTVVPSKFRSTAGKKFWKSRKHENT